MSAVIKPMEKNFGIICAVLMMVFLSNCGEASIDHTLKTYNKGSVPYLYVEEMEAYGSEYILDTRTEEEYKVSHIPGAIWVGYDSFAIENINTLIPEKDSRIIVYCSVGIRSEDIGEVLLENKFGEVRNLYGGIFEWKNKGMTVLDSTENKTENVHAYSKFWGRLLTEANKVY